MLSWFKRRFLAIVLVAAGLGVLPNYVRAFSLIGASAAPTIVLGDKLIVNRAAYDMRLPYSQIKLFATGSLRRGDLVQADLPDHIGAAIKRVLGLPGERIEVRENRVMVNGRALSVQPIEGDFTWVSAQHHMGSTVVMEDGHWCAYTPGKSPYRNSALVRLGPNEYFLMGDNRDNSLDSRAFGPVSRDKMLGKTIAILRIGPRVTRRD